MLKICFKLCFSSLIDWLKIITVFKYSCFNKFMYLHLSWHVHWLGSSFSVATDGAVCVVLLLYARCARPWWSVSVGSPLNWKYVALVLNRQVINLQWHLCLWHGVLSSVVKVLHTDPLQAPGLSEGNELLADHFYKIQSQVSFVILVTVFRLYNVTSSVKI